MGEYALYSGSEVKIGTCEDMLYLRADQAHLVTALSGSTDPVRDRGEIRFRFPWPDEDGTEPGQFDNPDRRVRVDGPLVREVLNMISPADHHRIQFTADGYNVCLPCPEVHAKADGMTASEGVLSLTDGSDHPYRVHRNGFGGALFVKQQKHYGGQLVTVVECRCGAAWRLETLEHAEPVIVSLRAMGDHEADEFNRYGSPSRAEFYHAIADRIAAGYVTAPVPVA